MEDPDRPRKNTLQNLSSPISKHLNSFSNLIESPVKGPPRQLSNLVASTPEKRKRTNVLPIVESPRSPSSKTISKKRVRLYKSCKKMVSCLDRGHWNDEGSGFSSPEKVSESKDVIDWIIISDEVESLKTKIISIY